MMSQNKKAFTIVELMLAMAFLGTMLMGIATLTMRITSIYQKGLTMRSINSTGREIIEDLTRTIGTSPIDYNVNPLGGNKISTKMANEAKAKYFITEEVTMTDKPDTKTQLGGIFCTGSYSYIWNTAEAISRFRDDDNSNDNYFSIRISVGGNPTVIIPRMARIPDKDRHACERDENNKIVKQFNGIDANHTVTESTIVELIGNSVNKTDTSKNKTDGDSDLVLYDFDILPASQNSTTKQIFYTGTFILGTVRGGINIKSNGDYCEGEDNPDDVEFTLNDFDYCSVNKFNFSARATGESNIKQYGDNK